MILKSQTPSADCEDTRNAKLQQMNQYVTNQNCYVFDKDTAIVSSFIHQHSSNSLVTLIKVKIANEYTKSN